VFFVQPLSDFTNHQSEKILGRRSFAFDARRFDCSFWIFAGFQVAMFAFVVPFAIAGAIGAYLFFAQHRFRGMRLLPANQWSYFRAALESSSCLKLSSIMNWFTANIGYHHIHHLNSHIPFYRLPEAMAAIPELRQALVTTLRPRDIFDSLRLNLWDTNSNQLVTYKDAATLS
jgi:omega-6 fatty acid desaturase (delta-12 desaturase)